MERNKNFGKMLLGAIVILLGGLLLLDNLNLAYLPWQEYLLSWKTILILVGAALLITQRNITAGIILTSLGTVFWLPDMLGHQITLSQVFWPSMLIVVGLLVMFNSRKYRNGNRHSLAKDSEPEVKVIQDPE